MSPLEIPVSTTCRESRTPLASLGDRRPHILITGSAGVLATVLARELSLDHDLIGLDVRAVREPDRWTEAISGSVGDRAALLELAAEADFALHLAHGAYDGWEGLRLVDIDGTRNLLDGAMRGRCRRVVICSSNHVAGWSELDYLAGVETELPVKPSSAPRPDGLYGVAKVAGEALARAAAELSGLPVSVLRVGTMRLNDDLELAAAESDFEYIGDPAAVLRRLTRTWLHHADLVRFVQEEFAAAETFRLRYATSSADDTVWSHEPLTWTAPVEINVSPATR